MKFRWAFPVLLLAYLASAQGVTWWFGGQWLPWDRTFALAVVVSVLQAAVLQLWPKRKG